MTYIRTYKAPKLYNAYLRSYKQISKITINVVTLALTLQVVKSVNLSEQVLLYIKH
jgi:hypothetical protein